MAPKGFHCMARALMLREARKSLGLTQGFCALRIGRTSAQSWGHYETGRAPIPDEAWDMLSKHAGIPCEDDNGQNERDRAEYVKQAKALAKAA